MHLHSIHAKKKACWENAETLPPSVLTLCATTVPSALSYKPEEIRAITPSPTYQKEVTSKLYPE